MDIYHLIDFNCISVTGMWGFFFNWKTSRSDGTSILGQNIMNEYILIHEKKPTA